MKVRELKEQAKKLGLKGFSRMTKAALEEATLQAQPLPMNAHGNIDVSSLPAHLAHIKGKRLQPLCRKLGIDHCPALTGFTEFRPSQFAPVLDGVVVRQKDAPRLLEAIAARDRRLKKKDNQQATQLDVCAALFTLNRRAKRCRDLAKTAHKNRQHRLAVRYREEKEDLYQLKGKTLHFLVAEGRLTHAGYHRFDGGNWAEILAGAGYTHHRPCQPPEVIPEDADCDSIEAKSKGAKEPTLAVARKVVENYLHGKPFVQIYQWPARPRLTRSRFTRNDFDDDFDSPEQDFDDGF
jgi:hypothetical protein